jgi:hypothetical protein
MQSKKEIKGISRRKFLKIAGVSTAAVGVTMMPWKFGVKEAYANAWSPQLGFG